MLTPENLIGIFDRERRPIFMGMDLGSFDSSGKNILDKGLDTATNVSPSDTPKTAKEWIDYYQEKVDQLPTEAKPKDEIAKFQSQIQKVQKTQSQLNAIEKLIQTKVSTEEEFTLSRLQISDLRTRPINVYKALLEANKNWGEYFSADDIQANDYHARLNSNIEFAIKSSIQFEISAIAKTELNTLQYSQFEKELHRHRFQNLLPENQNDKTALSVQEIRSVAQSQAPALIHAFLQKESAFSALPTVEQNSENLADLQNFLENYGVTNNEKPNDQEISIPWEKILSNIQDRIEKEPNPEMQKQLFESFLTDTKQLFGDSAEKNLLAAIQANREFKHLAVLSSSISTKEDAVAYEKAISSGSVEELYYQVTGMQPHAFTNLTQERLKAIQTQEQLLKSNAFNPQIVLDKQVFIQQIPESPQYELLSQWLTNDEARVFQLEDGQTAVIPNETTRIILPVNFVNSSNPEITVVVGKDDMAEVTHGKLNTLERTVEQTNNTLFVHFGIDAEHYIPGGLYSPYGQEVTQALAGLFFYASKQEQNTSVNDHMITSLQSVTTTSEFKRMMTIFFEVETPLSGGVSTENNQIAIQNFLNRKKLLTASNTIKSLSDPAWIKIREERKIYEENKDRIDSVLDFKELLKEVI